MIEEFMESAIIIDDNEEEVIKLVKILDEKDIWNKFYLPEQLTELKRPMKNRKIVFLDLWMYKEDTSFSGQLSYIRTILKKAIGKDFGTYGVVLWTKHAENIDELKEKIQNHFGQYTLPLFVVGLDKMKYDKSGYDKLFDDLSSKLETNIAAKFFIQWSLLVSKGKDIAITEIYSLEKDYLKQDHNLQFILLQMAKNYTGVPNDKIEKDQLNIDAYKAFNDMLNHEVKASKNTSKNIFKKNNVDYLPTNAEKINEEKIKICSEINRKLLIDENHIDQNLVVPGNVYQVLDDDSEFLINGKSPDLVPIVIEMTPPCDFSQRKMVRPRIIGGVMVKHSKNKVEKTYNKENYYKGLWPINVNGYDKPQLIVFDFRYIGQIDENDLKDPKKFKILFRAKNKLFADILQKASSHSSRLGLSIIHP